MPLDVVSTHHCTTLGNKFLVLLPRARRRVIHALGALVATSALRRHSISTTLVDRATTTLWSLCLGRRDVLGRRARLLDRRSRLLISGSAELSWTRKSGSNIVCKLQVNVLTINQLCLECGREFDRVDAELGANDQHVVEPPAVVRSSSSALDTADRRVDDRGVVKRNRLSAAARDI